MTDLFPPGEPVIFDFCMSDYRNFKKAIEGEDELGLILRCSFQIEKLIGEYIEIKTMKLGLLEGTKLYFFHKLRLAKNLGLPISIFDFLDKFSEVRNKYAHVENFKMSIETIDSFDKKLDEAINEVCASRIDRETFDMLRFDGAHKPEGYDKLLPYQKFRHIFLLYYNVMSIHVGFFYADNWETYKDFSTSRLNSSKIDS